MSLLSMAGHINDFSRQAFSRWITKKKNSQIFLNTEFSSLHRHDSLFLRYMHQMDSTHIYNTITTCFLE